MRDVWKIEQGLDFATLYSAHRMPHSSRRGPMDPARKALRAAIEGINARPGKILEGTYSSSIDGFFDVENVVIYNIETATFRNAGNNGICARRCRSFEGGSDPELPYKLDYRLVSKPDVPAMPIVHLQFVPTSFRSVFDIWWAATNGHLPKSGAVSGRYGLHVEFCGPILPTNPAGKLKILFDGIIAALQQDASPEPDAVARLALKHTVDANLIHAQLRQPVCSAIPSSRAPRLVRPYRAGVQWHPADDLCEECTLVVSEGPTPTCDAFVYALPSVPSGHPIRGHSRKMNGCKIGGHDTKLLFFGFGPRVAVLSAAI